MRADHCDRADSTLEWTTGNYSISTTPKIEWNFVVHAEEGPDKVGLKEWPVEKKLVDAGKLERCRKALPLNNFDALIDKKNHDLRRMGEELLTTEEVIGVRLYTGPMFERYNAVNRGGGLSIKQHDFMQ